MKRLLTGSVLFLLIGAACLHASSNIAYTDPANQGTQAWGGNLALDFNVISPITVTDLGVFNASGNGTIAGTIQVVIYNLGTNTQVTPIVTFHGNYAPAGLGFDVFQSIAPVVLQPGTYQVDAVGFSGVDLNGNLNTGSSSGPLLNGGGKLVFNGAAWDYSTVLDEPLTCDTCQPLPAQDSQFDVGTLMFGATPVPEPGAFAFYGYGVIAMITVLLRRKLAR